MLGLLFQWNVGRLETIIFMKLHEKNMKLEKYYAEIFSKTTVIEIPSQNWDGNRQLSREGIDVEYFTNSVHPGINIQFSIHI